MAVEWVSSVNRYRDTKTGRFLSPSTVEALVDKGRLDAANRLISLADELISESLTPAEWEKRFKQIIKETSIQQYATGRGGLSQLTPTDYGRIGSYLKDQYQYLKGFREALPNQSEAQIRVRSQMYASATKYMYEKGTWAAWDMPDLPAYPADGSSECLINDRCSWRIVKLKTPGSWNCFWEIRPGENCPTCLERASKWKPLKIRKGVIING